MGIDCSSVIEILDYVAIATKATDADGFTTWPAYCRDSSSCKEAAAKSYELVLSRCREGANVDLAREIIRPVWSRKRQ